MTRYLLPLALTLTAAGIVGRGLRSDHHQPKEYRMKHRIVAGLSALALVLASLVASAAPASAATQECNNSWSSRNIQVYAMTWSGKSQWFTLKPGQCKTDVLGEISAIYIPKGTKAKTRYGNMVYGPKTVYPGRWTAHSWTASPR